MKKSTSYFFQRLPHSPFLLLESSSFSSPASPSPVPAPVHVEAGTNCKSLQAVTIGSGVKELEAYAFKDCSSLQKVVSRIPADKLTATGSGCFENIGNKCVLYVPRGAKRVYENTLGWNNFAKIVEVDM